MHPDLEAILKAYDAALEASSGPQADDLAVLYESKFEEMLQKHRNLSEGQLQRMIDLAYRGWLRAQQKPTSIPPKA